MVLYIFYLLINKTNTIMKHLRIYLLFTLMGLFAQVTEAQGPFKKLERPQKKYGAMLGATMATKAISAYRFTGPMAGTAYIGDQFKVVTGLGFGYQRLHWVDSTQKYYADFSISAVIYAGGNVTPSIEKNNIMSIGLSLGVLNQLIMFGPCYNIPTVPGTKGSLGVVVNFSVPLNN